MMNPPPPDTAVVRISRGSVDPSRFAEVHTMTAAAGRYLIPVIKQLTGLMGRLQEMIVNARGEAEKAGVAFAPIISYPIGWSLR